MKNGTMLNEFKSYNIRHGDLCLCSIKELPKGLKQVKSKNIMQGSHGNIHSFDNGKLYLTKEDGFVFGYLVAKNTKLYHLGHGNKVKGKTLREAKIENGVYQLIRQNEDTNEGMKQVVD